MANNIREFGLNDNFILKFLFSLFILYLNLNLFISFFVYTYYMTFYTVILDIYYIFKYIYIYSNNVKIKEESFKVILFSLILLMCLPLSAIIFFYNIHKKWMNKVIIFILLAILLLILILCYYIKIFLIIFIYFLIILTFIIILYLGNKRVKSIVKAYKFFISLLISIAIYILNNIKI